MRCSAFYFLFLFGMVSCSEEINFEPNYGQKVTVNCILTPETKQTLTLTYTNRLNDFYYEKIDDAKISLFAGEEFAGYFEKNPYGDWEIAYTPVGGQMYKLTVEIPDMPAVEAVTTMPFDVPVTNDEESKETFVRKFFMQEKCNLPYWIFVMDKSDESASITAKDKLINSLGTNRAGCDRFNLSGSGMNVLIGQEAKTLEQQIYLRIVPNGNEVYKFCVEAPVSDSWFFFRAVSEEYDRYLKTGFQKMLVYQAFDDPSQ